jgi:hypothetical protein
MACETSNIAVRLQTAASFLGVLLGANLAGTGYIDKDALVIACHQKGQK